MNNKNVLAFGASNSRQSINEKLANYTASLVERATITFLDLNDFEMPVYSIDRENKTGIPKLAFQFKEEIQNTDGIIISFAEHNGAYTVAFKNIFDWISRINKNVWEDKPMFLLATAPGGHGGKSVLEMAVKRFKRGNKSEVIHFSLPFFSQNFSEGNGIINSELNTEFNKLLSEFKKVL
ncbi:MAG: NADPH-dependent FMN reductase [Draconibacterium sp.]|nr:NADPH-dependent FMN reductase [Draconibacterium sp.]